MREVKRASWMIASLLAIALAGCCDDDHPLGIQESVGGPPTVALGTSASFGALAGSSVANTGTTTITGDLGVSPGATVNGFPPGTATGTIHTADAAAAQAQADLTAAYNDAAARTTGVVSLPSDLGGLTLAPGLYNSPSALTLSGTVTFNALGNPDATFIIQTPSTLVTVSGSQMVLTGGAQASNIFWQVGTSATLGANSVFKGNLLADQAITLNTGE